MAVISVATTHVLAQQQSTGSVRLRPRVGTGVDSTAITSGDTVATARDTARFKKTRAIDLDNTVKFSSKDSMVLMGRNDLRFYGNSEVNYDDIKLTASSITMNMDSNVVHAVGVPDSLGELQGTPVFIESRATASSPVE